MMGKKFKPQRMVMTIEKTDEAFTQGLDIFPTGKLKLVGLRPATLRENAIAWFMGMFKPSTPDSVALDVALPMDTPVSLGIEISAETYTKLVQGNTKVTKAIDLLREQPVSMSLVVAPGCAPDLSPAEMEATAV